MAETSYERKVSATEAREGFIMVTKDGLGVFPAVGESFPLVHAGKRQSVALEAVDCTCRGADKPHQHYRIRWAGLRAGQCIRVTKADGVYELALG